MAGSNPDLGFERRSGLQQEVAHRLNELFSEGCAHHAPADGHQQFVLEVAAQARQRAAHRRLTQVEAIAGLRDIALTEQGIEGDQKIQVEQM